ncbi:MAG: hypothetical protein P4L55_02595 [Syntrophobacteraceae bacterium]|nr:hypothetical protein [Syntrophobacteraceae bacterium]
MRKVSRTDASCLKGGMAVIKRDAWEAVQARVRPREVDSFFGGDLRTAHTLECGRREGYPGGANKGFGRWCVLSVFVLTCMAWTFVNPSVSRAGFSSLYSFGTIAGDGANPYGSLILSGSTFYGMTERGGDYGRGAVFRINTDGSGYQVLYSFGGVANDGANPYGSLALSGSTLYGMTAEGGAYGYGAIFEIATDGSGYLVLHSFGGPPTDGANPHGSLLLYGTTLYGMTLQGGSTITWGGGYANPGTVFRINTDGSGYQVLYDFGTTVTDDGACPYGSLVLAGSTLYGMTSGGGNSGQGVIFGITTDGLGYQVLHDFGGVANDGGSPYGSLTLSGSTLYGMTGGGGVNGLGMVFQMNISGSGYQVLHSFGSVANDGAYPLGPLTLSGATLYGLTPAGGGNNYGAIFSINADGSGYQVLYSFAGVTNLNDLAYPLGPLSLSNSKLCGTTVTGGEQDSGAVFSLDVSPATGLWQNATNYGNGLMWLGWFGYFNVSKAPWIYHLSLGWLYPYGSSTNSIWFWDPVMKTFWWTSQARYPYIYRASDGAWLLYKVGTSRPRRFYNLKKGKWERE